MAHNHNNNGNISIAFFLNFFFTIVELIGGFLTNSVAIMSDAIHDFGDTFAIGMAWYFEKISGKKRNSSFTYGYKRFSVLGALLNCLILFVGSIIILNEAIKRIMVPEESHAAGMFLLAIFGILANGYAYYKTHKSTSINEKVVSLHLLEDVLGWLAVLIGSVIIYFTNWYIIDPILSIGITIYILIGVIKNLKSVLLIFLETAPKNINQEKIISGIKKLTGVKDIHDLHIWSLDGENGMMSAHVIIDFNENQNIKKDIKNLLEKNDIHHSTIEFEFLNESCENKCD